MLARGLMLYAARLLDQFAFWLGARLDISPTVSDVTVDPIRQAHSRFQEHFNLHLSFSEELPRATNGL